MQSQNIAKIISPKLKKQNLDKITDGMKDKFLDRSCLTCKKYPCFQGIENCFCDLAKYGCIQYKEK
jgi:hypothetical protein